MEGLGASKQSPSSGSRMIIYAIYFNMKSRKRKGEQGKKRIRNKMYLLNGIAFVEDRVLQREIM